MKALEEAPLGKKSAYVDEYDKSLLFPIPRDGKREEIGLSSDNLPFLGWDIWTAYEVSWLNEKGKPLVAVLDIMVDAHSNMLIESKSLKLYLNSFNNSKFTSPSDVLLRIKQDLTEAVGGREVKVSFVSEEALIKEGISRLSGIKLDDLDVDCEARNVNKALLEVDKEQTVSEVLRSDLLKSNCLVTGQPDWGSIQISYEGYKVNHESLLRYLVSFRNHNEFHEQCVERIFKDLQDVLAPTKLTVYARYTRRGGLDINPIRSTHAISKNLKNTRLYRQ